MKRLVVATLAVLALAFGVSAGEFFFPAEKGTVIINANMDNAGKKAKGFMRITIKDVEGEGNNITVHCVAEELDKKLKVKKNDVPLTYKVHLVDGAVIADLTSFMPIEPVEGVLIHMTGDTLRIPSDMSAGQKFDDVDMSITVDMGGGVNMSIMKVKTDFSIRDHKCLAVEKITLPAGTFEAYKTSYSMTASSKVLVTIKETHNITTWYVKGIGPVRTITANEKGKVKTYTQLHSINR